MSSFLLLATALVLVCSQTLTDISTLPPTGTKTGTAVVPPFTINGAQSGFLQPNQNRVVFAESGAGNISAVSLLGPTINQGSFTNMIVNPDTNGMDLVRGDIIYGGDLGLDHAIGPLALRPFGNNLFQRLGYLTTAQYASLEAGSLQSLKNYTQADILFSDLQVGEVIAVYDTFPQNSTGQTVTWSYAKILIVAKNANNSLTLSWTWYQLGSRKVVLAYGWNSPACVIEGVNGFWYVSEGGSGFVWKVPASNPSPTDPTSKKLFQVTNPQQLIYDPSAHRVYVAAGGKVVAYDALGGGTTVVISNLNSATGIASDTPTQFGYLYVSENTAAGHIYQFNLQTQDLKILKSNLNNPQFLTIDQDFPNLLFFPTNGALSQLDFSKNTPQLINFYSLTGAHELLFLSTAKVVITGQNFIKLLDFSAFSAQPLFIGIGHIPITAIASNGYATLTGANYPIHVTDSPFGGGLTLLINHPLARQLGFSSYSVYFNDQQINNAFGDYKWGPINLFQYEFIYTPTPADYELFQGYTYPVRNPADLWLNPFWGAYVDTTSVPTGLVTLEVRFWSGLFTSTAFAINVTIDNIWPQVSINQLRHYTDNTHYGNVGPCAIVQGTSTLFNFNITAKDPDKHLLDYALSAVWGANQGKGVYSASYPPSAPNPPASPPIWQGVTEYIVPQLSLAAPKNHWDASVSGDSTSTRCAHTFILGAWDRSINGWGYIHYSSYTYSVTFLLG